MYERLQIRRRIKLKKLHWGWGLFFLFLGALYQITQFIEPSLRALCEVRAKSLGTLIANEVVQEVMRDIEYLDLIILDRDSSGKIMALRANVIEMNKIAATIASEIQDRNSNLEEIYVKVPLGNFTGNIFLAGKGPTLKVKLIPTGSVKIDFKTEFVSAGINQIRHRVFLEVKSKMGMVAPFANTGIEILTEVNVAETVLIGDVPDSYYNLEGVKDVTTDDSLNMWE